MVHRPAAVAAFWWGVSGNGGDGMGRCGWKGLPRWDQRWDKALDCFFITLYTRTIYSAPCGGWSLPPPLPLPLTPLTPHPTVVYSVLQVYRFVCVRTRALLCVDGERVSGNGPIYRENGENQSSDFCIIPAAIVEMRVLAVYMCIWWERGMQWN